jgi:hypothetical protein
MEGCSYGNKVGGCGMDSSGSGWGSVVSCFKHCNDISGYIKGRKFD